MTTSSGADPARGGWYDPWLNLAADWPEVEVRREPLPGRLLGELRYPVIVLRRDSSAAQQRCTLTHELVHLERGVFDCGPWSAREERAVELEAARRLIPAPRLAGALRELGDDADPRALAVLLDVDRQTLHARLDGLSSAERRRLRARSWPVA